MDDEQPETEILEVPDPMYCTMAELREAREVYHLDLLAEIITGSAMSIAVLEGLAFIAYRRQGLPRAKARAAAAEIQPGQINPEDSPEILAKDGSPNPTSSVAS